LRFVIRARPRIRTRGYVWRGEHKVPPPPSPGVHIGGNKPVSKELAAPSTWPNSEGRVIRSSGSAGGFGESRAAGIENGVGKEPTCRARFVSTERWPLCDPKCRLYLANVDGRSACGSQSRMRNWVKARVADQKEGALGRRPPSAAAELAARPPGGCV